MAATQSHPLENSPLFLSERREKGDPLPRPTHALQKVHLDIVFGDGLGRLGYKYALIFIDRAIHYICFFGLKRLHAAQFNSAPIVMQINVNCSHLLAPGEWV